LDFNDAGTDWTPDDKGRGIALWKQVEDIPWKVPVIS
jgi:hypothetical protein